MSDLAKAIREIRPGSHHKADIEHQVSRTEWLAVVLPGWGYRELGYEPGSQDGSETPKGVLESSSAMMGL